MNIEINNKKIIVHNLTRRGFSIGEVMLSVFILGVAMVTILSLYSNSLRYLFDERDSVIASMLAQEGVELARNIRDNNWADRSSVTDVTPMAFDNFGSSPSNNCNVDINSTSISCGVADKKLYINGSNFYVHSGGTLTKFSRRMTLDFNNTDASDSSSVTVTSLVTWNYSGPPGSKNDCTIENKCVFSESILTDWGSGT
ncbi:MAG: hypothetical protein WC682_01695 [Parcubacteria group bacterium]